MKKVLILERKGAEKVSGYDHVFSFCFNPCDSSTKDYVSPKFNELMYQQEYDSIFNYLEPLKEAADFSYRGANLLWCFKKMLFEFAYFVRHRYETFKLVMTKHAGSDFYLEQESNFFQYPALARILEASPLSKSSNHHFFSELTTSDAIKQAERKTPWERCWPSLLKFRDLSRVKIVLFSDFEKSKSILKKTRSLGCVIFLNSKSPRTLLRAFMNRAAIFQTSFDDKNCQSHAKQVQEFTSRIYQNRLFTNYKISDLSAEPLLQKELERLFSSHLPKLFYEIDQMHCFFLEAKSLKSALLDEDVSPTKNAFCQVARQYHVRSFVECHGALGHKIGLLPLTANKIFMWGNAQKAKLAKWGCPEEQIIVSGCSRYDYYQQLKEGAVRNKVARQFGFDPKHKIVLLGFISTTINRGRFIFEDSVNQHIADTLAAMFELCRQEPTIQILLKVHPGDENLTYFSHWIRASDLGGRVIVIDRYDPLLLAKAADLLVIYASTYAVEGFALGKPVICLYDESWQLLEEFRKFPVFTYVNDSKQLQTTIPKLLHNWRSSSVTLQKARQECLNETNGKPEDLIVHHLVHV